MSCIHYKFKSSLDYNSVTFDGLHLSLADLKKSIGQQKRLKPGEFDLEITNAQTGDVYKKSDELIAKNTSVIVSRVPVTKTTASSTQKSWEAFKQECAKVKEKEKQMTLEKLKQTADIASAPASEIDKIKAVIDQSTKGFEQASFVNKHQTGVPYEHYVCKRCGQKGHYVYNCPNTNPEDRIIEPRYKRTTGIPTTLLTYVDDPLHPGALLTHQGKFAVPTVDVQGYRETKKERPPFLPGEKQPEPEKKKIPQELLCHICEDLCVDAAIAPCCGTSFCDECLREVLLESDDHQCPSCKETNVSPDRIVANRSMRLAVTNFLNDSGYTKVKRRRSSSQSGEGIAPALHQSGTKPPSPTEPPKPLDPGPNVNSSPTYTEPRPVNQQHPEPKPVNQQHPQPGPHVPGHFSHRPPYHGSVRGGYRPQFSSSYSYTRPPRFAPNQYTKPWRFENNQNSNNEASTISTISRRPDYSQTPYADEPPPASQPTDDGRSSSAEPAAPGTSPAADRRSSTESKIPSSSSIWPPVSSPKHTAPPTLANTAISLPSHPSIPVTRPVPVLSVPPMGHQPFTAIPPNFPRGFPVPRPAGPVIPAPGIPPPVPLTREEFYQAKKMFQATDVQPKKPVDVFDSFADFTKRRSRSPERRGSYSRSHSGSPWVKKSRSRSFSPDKRRSRSLSPRRYTPRSRSRSGPRSSIRSRSRSKPRSQNRSRSRSGGRLLNRSRSRSYDSKRLSRPRSRSRTPPRLKSRSRSRSGHRLSKPLSPRNRSPLPPLRRSSKSPLPPLRRSSKSPPPLRRSSKSPLPPLRRSSKSPLRPLRSRSRSLSYRRLSRSRSKSWSKRARSRSRSYSRPKSPRPLSPRRSPWRSPRRSPLPRSPFRKRSYSPRRRSRSFSPRKRSPYRSRSRTPLSKRKSRSRTRSPLPKKRSLTPLHSPRRSKSPYKKPLSPLPFTGFRRRSPSPFRGRGGYRGRGRGGYGGYRDFNKENRDRPRNHASPPMPSGQAPPLPPHNLPPVPYLPQMGLPPPEEYFKYNPQGYQDFVRSFYAQFGPQAQAWAQNQTFSLPTGDGFNAGASGSAVGAPGQRPPWETVPMSPSHRPRSITPPPGNQLGDRKEMSYRDRDAGGDRPWQKDREGGGNRPGDRERDRQDHRDRERDRQPDRNRDGYKYQDRDRGRDPDRYRREGDRRERGRDDDRNKSRDDDRNKSRDDDRNKSRDDDRNKSRDDDRNKSRDDDRNKNRDNYRDRDNKEKERDGNKSRDKALSDRRRSPSRKGKEEEKSRGKDKKKTDKKKDGKENKRSKSQAENDSTKNSTEPKDSSATKSSTREEKDNQAQPVAKAEKADKSMENQSPLKVKNESAESEKQNVDQSQEAGAGDAATTEKVGKSAGKEKKTVGKKKGDGAGTKKKLKDSSGEGGAAAGEKKVKKVKKKKLTFGAPDADIKQGLKKKKGKRLVDYKSENCTSEEGEEKNSLSASPTKKARLAEIKEEDTDTAKSGNENSQVSSSEATMEVNTDKSQAKQAVKQEAAGDDTGSSETARVGDKAEQVSAELPLSKWEMEEDFDYFENLDQPREKPQEKMMLPRSVVDKAEKFLSLKPMKNAVMVGHVTSTKSPETSPDKPTSESKTSSPPSNKSSRRVFLDQKKDKKPEDLQITVKTDKRKNENASKRGSATSRSEDHHRHHHHHHQHESDDYEEDQRSVVRSQSLERELQDNKSSRSHKDKSEKSSKKDRSSRGSVGEKVTRQDSKKDRSDSGKEKHEHSPEHRERRHSKDGGSAAYSDAPTKSSKDLRHKLEEKNKSKSAVDHRKLSVMDESEFVPDYEDAEGASDNERDDATTSQNSGMSTPETPDAKDSKKRKRSAADEDEEKTKDDSKPDGEEGGKHKKSKKKHKHKEKNKDKKEKHKHKKKKHKHKKSKEKEGKQKVNKEQDSS